jgi:putative sterol carrier protein
MEPVELFSQEWCDEATKMWETIVYPLVADKDGYNYAAEWTVTDHPDQICQFQAEKGHILWWKVGKHLTDDECAFLVTAKLDHWNKVAHGQIEPVAAVAAKRIHLRKGPMQVVINESEGFTKLIQGFGGIPTKW